MWKASLDPISKAYVDEIKVIETDSATSVQQQLQTNSPNADLEWGDTPIPPAQLPALLASHNPGVYLGLTQGQDPFIIFNQKDPNFNKAMQNVNVRRAISYALDRAALITDAGGPQVSPPLTQLLPPGVPGTSNFDLYPYNPAKAKKLLGGKHYTFKFLYQINNPVQVKMFQTIQYELSAVGITVQGEGVPSADIYVKYYTTPTPGEQGVWDFGFGQWYPDWYGNNAASFLIDQYQTSAIPPIGDNFGFESNPKVNSLDRQSAPRAERRGGELALGAGRPPGHGGRGCLHDQLPAVRHVPPDPGAQRRLLVLDPGDRPDERLAVAERPSERPDPLLSRTNPYRAEHPPGTGWFARSLRQMTG